MSYYLGRHSIAELGGVHPELVRVVNAAIRITEQDFTVLDGARTIEEQREYVARGVSRTMKSRHLIQDDGYGHAVDLVPYINGKVRWELEPCYVVARAVRQAAQGLGSGIRWGGCWSRLDTSDIHPARMVKEYIADRRRQVRRPFVDAVHYGLV